MKVVNLKSKQRQMHRALQSIAFPTHNQKAITEAEEHVCEIKKNLYLNDEISKRQSNRYGRQRELVMPKKGDAVSQSKQIKKFGSLELGKRKYKISEHKLQPFNQSNQANQYHPSRRRRSYQTIKASQSINNRYSLNSKSISKGLAHVKLSVRQLMERRQYEKGLSILNQVDQLDRTDAQYLQLKGACYLKMQKYQKALESLSRAIVYEKQNCRQIYIWCSLCQLQLNHRERCLKYVDQCIRLFPEHYEAYYFKGKVCTKYSFFDLAIECFHIAAELNPENKDVKCHLAECLEQKGQYSSAVIIYQQILIKIDEKHLVYSKKYAKLLLKLGRIQESQKILQKCIEVSESRNDSLELQEVYLECQYLLAIGSFKKGEFEKSIMKGEQILKRGSDKWVQQIVKVMVAAMIATRDFYGAVHLSERLNNNNSKINLKQFGLFCEGVILLMRKKALEGAQKIQECEKMLKREGKNQLNTNIYQVYHLYLFYAYFLMGKDDAALRQLQLQKREGLLSIYEHSTEYNRAITQGYISYFNGKFTEAVSFFKQSLQSKNRKPDALLYLSLTLSQLAASNQSYLVQLKQVLNQSCTQLYDLNGNISAYAFYHRGLFKAWQGQFESAVLDLDLAIDKSEDNFVRFFYLRGLIWGLLQNYKQAISDVSIAISIDPQDSQNYELRTRCLQIDGDPGQAFADLQTFIALNPDDREIHKLAGYLLFENGAFEDVIQAFNQGQHQIEDIQVYLTRSKTYFLLGNFIEAGKDMLQASRRSVNSEAFLFDYEMMKWLGQLFLPNLRSSGQDFLQFDPVYLQSCMDKLSAIYKSYSQKSGGKIFKLTEFYCFQGMCNFYQSQYQSAINSFVEVVNLKISSFAKDLEGDYEQDQTEKRIFINQMYYNVAICYCMLKDYKNAEKFLNDCQIDNKLHTFDIYDELLKQVRGEAEIVPEESYLDLFTYKNKISRFLPRVAVPFVGKESQKIGLRPMKICIPYPKVQPPNINPTFNLALIKNLSLNQIERRPEAPWIFKENNAIKFTDRMEVYSRFSLGESSVGDVKKVQFGESENESQNNVSYGILNRLKLDTKVEERLNKIINNR